MPSGPRATTRPWSRRSCSRSGRCSSRRAASARASASSTSPRGPATPPCPRPRRGRAVIAATSRRSCWPPERSGPRRPGLELEWEGRTPSTCRTTTARFDVVMSSIGAMFAPNHQAVADELVRVCRPGGTIGFTAWTPEGQIGAMFRLVGPFAPATAAGAQPPPSGARGPRRRALRRPGRVARARPAQPTITAFRTPRTTPRTSASCTGPPSPRARRRRRRAARPSSTRRSTGSAREWNRGDADAARFEQEYLLAVGTRV